MAITIDPGLCPQNHACPLLSVCPEEAITQQGNHLPQVDTQKCVDCGVCVQMCGMGAAQLEE